MNTIVRRTGDDGQNFTQTTHGETPNSVEVSTANAKGVAQITIKLYFATPEDLAQQAGAQIRKAFNDIRAELAREGIPLAGDGGGR